MNKEFYKRLLYLKLETELKAWDESKHPRHPKGTDKGGEFTKVQMFLKSLKETDFQGTKTQAALKRKAKGFLNSGVYEPYEKFNGFDIHNSLLALIYDNV